MAKYHLAVQGLEHSFGQDFLWLADAERHYKIFAGMPQYPRVTLFIWARGEDFPIISKGEPLPFTPLSGLRRGGGAAGRKTGDGRKLTSEDLDALLAR